MTNAAEVSGGFQSALPTAPPRPRHLVTRIPDCEATPLDGLGDIDPRTLDRLLSPALRPGPSFDSSI
ncbi:hypothetical protein [Streptomyces spongiae]|uniref:FXSXX-COOH protein n=1 Tax=Streptomyces spongiae TaxID=565072 RepID=A0A5N8XBK9_9ACTN|nr:hypothetical protein [Streptomyces spongiae]MPY56900.1 hypothetical protein [Streptomyces spongiae]